MKKQFMLLTALFFTVAINLFAQDCNSFFPFRAGIEMEYSFYDKKDKLSSQSTHKVVDVKTTGGKLEATIETMTTDSKGKNPIGGSFTASCDGEVVFMDMSSMMTSAITDAFSSMDVTMTGDQMQIPSKLSVGQSLPDASMNIKAGSGGISIVNVTVNITNRKVIGKEKISTESGSYDCYKISYTTDVKSFGNRSYESVMWFSPNVGMVRQESFDKKGNVDSRSELTKYKKA